MSPFALAAVAILHCGAFIGFLVAGKWADALMMAGFTIADVGFLWRAMD